MKTNGCQLTMMKRTVILLIQRKTKPNPAKKSKKDESVSSVAKYMNSLQTQSNLKLALVSFFCFILIKQTFYEIYFKEIRESEIRILEKTQHFDLCVHNLRAAFKLNQWI